MDFFGKQIMGNENNENISYISGMKHDLRGKGTNSLVPRVTTEHQAMFERIYETNPKRGQLCM